MPHVRKEADLAIYSISRIALQFRRRGVKLIEVCKVTRSSARRRTAESNKVYARVSFFPDCGEQRHALSKVEKKAGLDEVFVACMPWTG